MAKTGILSKLYLRTAGNFASPTFTEVPIIGDVAIAGTWNFGESITRETPVVRGARTTLPLSITGTMAVRDDDTNYIVFDDAYHNSAAVLDVMILNGSNTTNNVTGFRAEFELLNWGENQAAGNVLMKDWELRPTISANLPKRVKVTAGAPVFTNIT
jgi:hypothetical protein